jgi:two-component system, response regulator, stage 0 sporulation protein A
LDNEIFAALVKEVRLLRNEITDLKTVVLGQKVLEPSLYKGIEGMDGKISALLLELKVPPHIIGYNALREAIKMVYHDLDLLGCMTTRTYPEIAKKLKSEPNRIERAIRHAIDVSWNRNKSHLLYRNHSVHKPTNSEFIAMIADKFWLEEKSKLEVV